MNYISSLTTLVCITLLMACNGSSGDNDSVTDPSVATNLTLSTYDNQGNNETQFKFDELARIVAKVTDQDGVAVANSQVTFSSTIGELVISSRLTNNEGLAEVELSNPNTELGASTLTATTGDLSATSHIEFVNLTPILTTTLTIDGIDINEFVADQNVEITSILLDKNLQPQANTIIHYSTDKGFLTASSATTDIDGKATITLQSNNDHLGQGTLTATYQFDGSEPITTATPFTVLSQSRVDTLKLSSTILLNGVATNRFKADENAQVQALLVSAQGEPIANEIVDFVADIGALSATSALTNDKGLATVTITGSNEIGAGVIALSYRQDGTISTQMNYEILSADAIIDDEVRLGYFDENNLFIDGALKISARDSSISAGGTLGLSVDLVDNNGQRVTAATPVTFTSNCVQNSRANIDETVFSINGTAKATFEDIDCAGLNGTEDVIVANVTVNNITNIASSTVTITGEAIGSIEFISAEPNSIVLKGTGGQGKQETSILTFLVKSDIGNIIAQQQVSFELSTQIGGITLSRTSALTNSEGLVSTRVAAGTVPTAVRVTATAEINGNSVQSQSDLLSINTGLPEQRSLTVAASILNPEGDFNGETSVITAWLADNFNNPVPDGTTVNFTTEGGNIDASCNTLGGTCSVTWESSEPRLPTHRSTILVSALGHESFFDTNGNNFFDDADGRAIIDDDVSSGLGRHTAKPSGFIDMSEAWRDDNENQRKDRGEIFLDFNKDELFSAPDGRFNGPQCQGSTCSNDLKATHVRKALVLIMASASNPIFELVDSNAEYCDRPPLPIDIAEDISSPPPAMRACTSGAYAQDSNGIRTLINLPSIADGTSLPLSFRFADNALQTLPFGSVVDIEADGGEIRGQTTFDVGNTSAAGLNSMSFLIVNAIGGDPEQVVLTISITSPNRPKSTYVTLAVNLL